MAGQSPAEVASLAVSAVAAVSLGAVVAWYWVRKRQIELAAFTSDDQAARVLAESLAKGSVQTDFVAEVMAAFAQLDSGGKRALAAAVAGLVSATELNANSTLPGKIREVARVFLERGRVADVPAAARERGPSQEHITARKSD